MVISGPSSKKVRKESWTIGWSDIELFLRFSKTGTKSMLPIRYISISPIPKNRQILPRCMRGKVLTFKKCWIKDICFAHFRVTVKIFCGPATFLRKHLGFCVLEHFCTAWRVLDFCLQKSIHPNGQFWLAHLTYLCLKPYGLA